MTRWTEIIIPVERSPDPALLLDVAVPLVEAVRPALAAWHYFWEPDLHLRLGWRGEADDAAARAWLDAARARGALGAWSFGSYDGDAAMLGEEVWDHAARDFEGGAEYASALLALERRGALGSTRDFFWARHVHCFSNQLVGTWSEEARLCVLQARYRAALLARARVNAGLRPRLRALVDALDGVLADAGAIQEAEAALLDAWRSQGRPDLATMLELPDDFARDPSEEV